MEEAAPAGRLPGVVFVCRGICPGVVSTADFAAGLCFRGEEFNGYGLRTVLGSLAAALPASEKKLN